MSCAIDCYSNYLRDKINDHIHGGPSWTPPGTTYFALMNIKPHSDGTGGVEVTGGNYSRLAITNSSASWNNSLNQVKTNGIIFTWGLATGVWTQANAIAEYDASTIGNLLTFGDLNFPTIVQMGSNFSLDIGALSYGWA